MPPLLYVIDLDSRFRYPNPPGSHDAPYRKASRQEQTPTTNTRPSVNRVNRWLLLAWRVTLTQIAHHATPKRRVELESCPSSVADDSRCMESCHTDAILTSCGSYWHHSVIMAQHQQLSVGNSKVGANRCNHLPQRKLSFASHATHMARRLTYDCNRSFYCWGPSKPPIDMSQNEYARWNAHMQTPVIFNQHAPLKIESTTIQNIDLNPIKSTRNAVANEERVLLLTPLKDAASHLSKYFELLAEISYPHHLIDLAFLVSDSMDDTLALLASELDRIQRRPDKIPFRSATVVQKDFNFHLSQDVNDRHSFEAQAPRRKAMGKARNYLLYAAMKPEHSWVYWRDVDIVDSPSTILEDFIAHDKDVLVPSKDWRPFSSSSSSFFFFVMTCLLILRQRCLVPPIRKRCRR